MEGSRWGGTGGVSMLHVDLRNDNVALSILRKYHVTLSILRKRHVALSILRKCNVACR